MSPTSDVPSPDGASTNLNVPNRPDRFRFDIASGVLESLGLNMYTSIGKSLSEFVANAYDADATEVSVSIPFSDIEIARTKLREAAKADVAAGKRDKFTALADPLPPTITITIADDGHGMSPDDIERKYLVGVYARSKVRV